MKNVLEYLEASADRYPDKIAARDMEHACTYRELLEDAKRIGAQLATVTKPGNPVAVLADKCVDTLKTFMGIVYAGCFYTLVDPSFPEERICTILDVLKPDAVIVFGNAVGKPEACGFTGQVFDMQKLIGGIAIEQADEILLDIRSSMTDTMPLYCNFTSGSTGTPKGVLVAHRSVIEFIDCFTEMFHITEEDVIGNQAPFDFDVSVKDIYSALKTGATLVIIPKSCFMFPNSVVDMLEEANVTTLIWAVSALCLLNRLHAFKYKIPKSINKVLFSGEAMPIRQLNDWRKVYPDAMFVNLYGPTEITCNCTYYVLDRAFTEEEKLPIGHAFPNERVCLLGEDGSLIPPTCANQAGELCVLGTTLALGYYRNPEMTAKAFVQNPWNDAYPELMYKTGDLASYGEDGMLYFAGRKDFQIKHMGHRIELEEIEHVLSAVPCVEQACCFYDEEKNKVVACYIGTDDKKYIMQEMRTKVPDYMVPNVFCRVEELPMNKNGKTDKKAMKALYKEGGLR